MKKLFSSIISLLYPKLCIGCDREEPVFQEMYCSYCWHDLPRFGQDDSTKNLIKSRFPLLQDSQFIGLYLFTKSGIVQNVLHKIKYRGRKDIAHSLGERIAEKVKHKEYDAIIPVPLHKTKQLKRGFNQAEEFALGIATQTKIIVLTDYLIKSVNTKTQTQLDRITRRMNIAKAYDIKRKLPDRINKILLVDDVVTTGATLEACSTKLKESNPKLHIDFAFIALSV